MTLDKDLESIQEVRDLLLKAKAAQLEFRNYSQEQVDQIVKAMADAGHAEASRLGRMASEETGFGKPEDKQKKNEFATRRVWESIKDLKTVGAISEDKEKKLILIGEPMGVKGRRLICAPRMVTRRGGAGRGRHGVRAPPSPNPCQAMACPRSPSTIQPSRSTFPSVRSCPTASSATRQ